MTAEMDLNYQNLSKVQVIKKYQRNLDILRRYANERNISDDQFDKYVSEDINRMVMPRRSITRRLRSVRNILDRHRKAIIYLTLVLVFYALFFYKREVTALLLRHIQVYIYPGMRLWRKVTAPVLLFFPSLSELYDESCLVANPYFQVDGLNCSPCTNVKNVLDLSNFDSTRDMLFNDNIPYMFRTDQRQVTVRHFLDIYNDNREEFEKDAFKVKSTNVRIRNLMDLGTQLLNRTRNNRPESHNLWRCNRMSPARALRKYFPHPKRFPKTGLALERFLSFDTPAAKAYRLPDTECPNVFLTQVQGNRKIVLMPTQECRSECRTLSVRLPTSYVLKYNWWYYKPISLPDEISTSDSVTYVGSYC